MSTRHPKKFRGVENENFNLKNNLSMVKKYNFTKIQLLHNHCTGNHSFVRHRLSALTVTLNFDVVLLSQI